MSTVSNLLIIGECLLDARRTKAFQQAIQKAVKPGDTVVDAGTGSGILALFAAQSGAKKVYGVEKEPELAEIAELNVKKNHFGKKISVINVDVKNFFLPGKKSADVLIMEMLDTGLIVEEQCQTIIALKKNQVISDKTILLPDKVDCYLELIEYDFNFYGFELPFVVQARNFGAIERIKNKLSKPILYASFDLKKTMSTNFNASVEIPITKTGYGNAVTLTSKISLLGKIISATTDMNMPAIVPFQKRKKFQTGNLPKLKIFYKMSGGFQTLKIIV